ncbi:MAG: tetratricopeptide repeat protein, partial [Oscillatoria sp. PMC 1068.18]|nr:tetratricopeptide repeat protein [Oscillatoria sp. PMC 1068.18]
MDEQRIREYLNLIEQLLSCPDGEELAILQRNPLLFDEELVAVMLRLAEQMAEAGDNNAQWLHSFANQIAEAMNGWNQLNQQVIQLYHQGKFDEAVNFAEQALTLAVEILGEEHPNVATSLNNLAGLYESQGR